MASIVTKSPSKIRGRQSIGGSAPGLKERDANAPEAEVVRAEWKGKRRAVQSMGGRGQEGQVVGLQTLLSPKSLARRVAKPRKSILKAFSNPVEDEEEHNPQGAAILLQAETERTRLEGRDLTLPHQQYSHGTEGNDDTTTFGSTANFQRRQSIARRVSFAPSAHVRMFEASAQSVSRRRSSMANHQNTMAPPPPAPVAAGPRQSNATHGRRSSIQAIPAVPGPDDGGGEMSMELEESTDSEEGEDSEDDQVHVQQSIYPQLPTHAAEVEAESDDDGEMSMEETQVFNPQDLQHEGEGDESMISESEANTSRSDMSMTMDFTVAIGGLLPQAPPAGAQRGRQSVGYNHVDPENGEPLIPGEGEDDMEMDETTVFGGIINITTASRMDPDDTISTASGSEDTMNMSHRSRDPTLTFSHNSLHDLDSAAREERSVMGIDTTEGMDVTTATGGIFSQSYQRPQQVHSHTLSQSQSQSQTQTQVQVQVQMQMASSTPKSPRVTSITQPMGGTPSFARATASSASKAKSRSPQKEKRNIFGPSPSPFKGHSTPRKSGMQTAGEVAKRLSFGSATSGSSSSSKKRTVDTFTVEQEEKENQTYEQPSSAKKQRLSAPTALGLGESVFGSASAGAIVLGSKAASPVAKLMAQSPRVSSPARAVLESTTPSRSPAIRRAMGVADTPIDDAEEDEDEGEGSKEEPRTIGMRAFLDMAGVQFDDSAPSVLRRRSSAARGLLGQDPNRKYGPDEYIEGKTNLSFLNHYIWATAQFRSDINTMRSDISSTESIYMQYNPPVVREYMMSNKSDREMFHLTFKRYKMNTQLKAEKTYQEWESEVMRSIRGEVEEVYFDMVKDQEKVDSMTEGVEEYLPLLRERAKALEAELIKEREIVAEIGACDRAELEDWKSAAEETTKQLEVASVEFSELSTKLADLRTRLADQDAVRSEHESAIGSARSKCDEYTKSDVSKLQREYESIQELHQWKIDSLRSDRLEMTYAQELRLSFTCSAYTPDLASVGISLVSPGSMTLKQNTKGPRAVSGALLELVKAALVPLVKANPRASLAQVVQRVGALWTSAQRLRAELDLVSQQYPTRYSTNGSKDKDKDEEMVVYTTILLPPIRAKVDLVFRVGVDVLDTFPGGLTEIGIDVKVVYGNPDAALLKLAAEETVATASDAGYIGTLINACRDAAQQSVEQE